MRRTRSPNNSGSLPAITGTETPGYYTEGPPATIVSAADLNILQEELVAVATMKGAALDATGADRAQCKTAVDAVLGVEALSDEATGVDTVRKLVVLASDDATVGETDGGVVHALVAASNSCSAKGFETAVIASKDSRAGATDGSTIVAAVIASTAALAEGANSAVLASDLTTNGPVGGAAGSCCAVIAAHASSGDGVDVNGTYSAAIAVDDATVAGVASAVIGGTGNSVTHDSAVIVGGDGNAITAASSGIVGGVGNEVAGGGSGVIASSSIKVTSANAGAIAATGSGTSSEVTGTNALLAATGDSKATGTQSAVLGGNNNEANKASSVIIGSENCKAESAGNQNVVILASRHYESTQDTDAPPFSVAMGYHATTATGRQIALEANGGNVYYDGSSSSPAADYAEWFPNGDGVAHPVGTILARRGGKVFVAGLGDRIVGVVSAQPTVTGGSDELGWVGKWARDEFGAFIWEVGPDGIEQRQVNPAYDPTRRHTPRSERLAEHTCVGLLGQLRVRVDATVAPDDEVVAGEAGIGTRGSWAGRGAQLECMEIVSPFDAARGYAIALCLLR